VSTTVKRKFFDVAAAIIPCLYLLLCLINNRNLPLIFSELETLFETAHLNYLQQTAQRTHDFKELTQNDQKLTADIDKMRKKIDVLQTSIQQVSLLSLSFSLSLCLSLSLSLSLSAFLFFCLNLFLSVRLSPFFSLSLSFSPYHVNLLILLHDCLVLFLTFQKILEHSTGRNNSNINYSKCNPAWSGAFHITLSILTLWPLLLLAVENEDKAAD
jgi:hypothetical protein